MAGQLSDEETMLVETVRTFIDREVKPPAARRLRLHIRIPRRPCLRRHTCADDLWRHHRDHEGDHRARHRPGRVTIVG